MSLKNYGIILGGKPIPIFVNENILKKNIIIRNGSENMIIHQKFRKMKMGALIGKNIEIIIKNIDN